MYLLVIQDSSLLSFTKFVFYSSKYELDAIAFRIIAGIEDPLHIQFFELGLDQFRFVDTHLVKEDANFTALALLVELIQELEELLSVY